MRTAEERISTGPTEEDFIEWSRRLRKGDRGAFTDVFQAMHIPLIRYGFRLTGSEEAAQDVVQDVFLKLWQVRDTLDDERSLKAFLFTMVHNLSLNHKRNQNQQGVTLSDSEEQLHDHTPGIDEQLAAEMLEQTVNTWIEEMPDRRKEAFILSRFHGLSHEEIADIMSLTPRTVNTHIVLALKYLRGKLDYIRQA